MMTTNFVFRTSMSYVASGMSVIPISPDETKAPCAHLLPRDNAGDHGSGSPSWKIYQRRRAFLDELTSWFGNTEFLPGIAIVGGQVSGGLEVIDLDDEGIAKEWFELLAANHRGLLANLPIVMTPRPGYHVYYRRSGGKAAGSHKLAEGPHPDDPSKPKTLIEVKGEGGYVLAPGCSPACHETGRLYLPIGMPYITQVPVIDDSVREILLSAARSLNRWTIEPRRFARPIAIRRRPLLSSSLRPGDVYEVQTDWAEILLPARWTFVGSSSDGVERWCRPGKRSGVSATVDYGGLDRLYVFSSSAHPFEPGRMYSKFQAFTLLQHQGDYKAAARALRRQGHGGRPSFAVPIQSLADRIVNAPLIPIRTRRS